MREVGRETECRSRTARIEARQSQIGHLERRNALGHGRVLRIGFGLIAPEGSAQFVQHGRLQSAVQCDAQRPDLRRLYVRQTGRRHLTGSGLQGVVIQIAAGECVLVAETMIDPQRRLPVVELLGGGTGDVAQRDNTRSAIHHHRLAGSVRRARGNVLEKRLHRGPRPGQVG